MAAIFHHNFPGYVRVVSAIKLKQLLNRLPVFKTRKYNRYILLGRARTGSTLLHTYLNSHPRVLSLDELFHPNTVMAAQKQNLVSFAEQVAFRPFSGLIKAVGFKMFYEWQGQGYETLWHHFQQDTSIRIIHLKRRNHLRTLVSLQIARQNQQWAKTGREANQTNVNKTIRLSAETCVRHFEQMEEEEQRFDSLFKNHLKLEIFYEDLVKQPTETLNRVQDFLGVRRLPLLSLLQKQNPEPLPKLLQNYAELEAAFKPTMWQTFFTEQI